MLEENRAKTDKSSKLPDMAPYQGNYRLVRSCQPKARSCPTDVMQITFVSMYRVQGVKTS
ncbi:hypothetical protein HanOQP8_Chr01g0020721 [Helianthus annuus]|nr:hypothetical protein HanOQP8_Chr01g0020721 [Helianthus annuus]